MHRPALALPILLLAVAFAGCHQESPYAVQVLSPCIRQNTANLTFSNSSVTNTSYDVLVDGAQVAVVAPGATSPNVSVKALFLHVIQFNVSNTTTPACTVDIVTPGQCTTTNLVCRS